ncbi:unnamed protein product, partial [Polarella glacialis]
DGAPSPGTWVKQASEEDPVDAVSALLPLLLAAVRKLPNSEILVSSLEKLEVDLKEQVWLALHEKPVIKLGTWLLNTRKANRDWQDILSFESSMEKFQELVLHIEDVKWEVAPTAEEQAKEENSIARTAAGLGATLRKKSKRNEDDY